MKKEKVVRYEKNGMEEGKKGGEEGREIGRQEEGKGEEKKKVGRPSKAEGLMRDRANSLSLIDAFKRGEKRKEIEVLQAEICKKSLKELRSQEKQPEKQPEKQEKGGMKEDIKGGF